MWRTLHGFRGGLRVFRNIHRRQLRHIDAGAWLEHVRQRDAEDDGNRGDHFEIDDGFRADAA